MQGRYMEAMLTITNFGITVPPGLVSLTEL